MLQAQQTFDVPPFLIRIYKDINPATTVPGKAELNKLLLSLQYLPDCFLYAIVLKYFSRKSSEEISVELGISLLLADHWVMMGLKLLEVMMEKN